MHEPCVPLSDIMPMQRAKISSFHTSDALCKRLYSLGMIPDTEVCCLYRRKGGLAAFDVRGSVIALRLCDACAVLVKRI